VASLLHTASTLHAAGKIGAVGRPWAWGSGECDQLGMAAGKGQKPREDEDEDGYLYLSDAKSIPGMQKPPCSLPTVLLTAGGMHTVAVLTDGSALSWGCNDEGQLGRQTKGVLP